MMHRLSSRALLWILAVLAVIGMLGTALFTDVNLGPATYFAEQVKLVLHPSAERAYAYGKRHFDHNNAAAYNLDQAEYFFELTLKLDPSYPLANHQIARIHFLKGDFSGALPYINAEITLQAERNPSAYYVRGLIYGYQGLYTEAAADFERFLQLRPNVWAGYNDEAWALMKGGQYSKALSVLLTGLKQFPDNPWLLNSFAIALYESGTDTAGARTVAARAREAIEKLTPADWANANPGNDPRIASEGLETFKNAAINNLEKIMAGTGATIDPIR